LLEIDDELPEGVEKVDITFHLAQSYELAGDVSPLFLSSYLARSLAWMMMSFIFRSLPTLSKAIKLFSK
jgi:hypothetical protein